MNALVDEEALATARFTDPVVQLANRPRLETLCATRVGLQLLGSGQLCDRALLNVQEGEHFHGHSIGEDEQQVAATRRRVELVGVVVIKVLVVLAL